MNDGLPTLQFQNIAVDPTDPLDDLLGGTQDNGTPGIRTATGAWSSRATAARRRSTSTATPATTRTPARTAT